MTIFEFNEQLCEIIAGEDGYYNYSKQEILDKAKDMKTSAEEWDDLQDARTQTQNKDARTQAEIDDEILLEEHYNRKAGIYPEPDGDPSY